MNPRKTKDISSQLKKKGFVAKQGDHTFFYLYYRNKKTSVYTKLSHSIKEYSDNLLSQMAKQLSLTNSELKNLIECPLTYDNLIEILKEKNKIKI